VVAIVIIIAFFGFCLYLVIKIKNFFVGLFSGSSSNRNSRVQKHFSTVNKSEPQLSDVIVRNGYQLETVSETGRRIASRQLKSHEELAGFSEHFFVTVSDYIVTTYDVNCRKIASRQLSGNEEFYKCLSNSFTTRDNSYIISYDKNCKYLSKKNVN